MFLVIVLKIVSTKCVKYKYFSVHVVKDTLSGFKFRIHNNDLVSDLSTASDGATILVQINCECSYIHMR